LRVLQARASRASREHGDVLEYVADSGSSGFLRWRAAAKLAAIVVLAVGLPILVGALGGGERLRVLVEQSGPWAPLTYVAAKAAATIVAPFSGVPLKAASGALFGLTGGVFYSLFGDVIGGCVCFLAARYAGWSPVERLTGDSRKVYLNRVLDRSLGGWRELLFFRITFPAVYNLLSYAAGSTKIPFRQYLAVTAFGGIIHTSILVTLGASVALSWEVRLAAYAGIAVLSVLALLGVRHLRGVLARGT
jgi:uncharacterized membrane protein YdjX (TVP38/TMEM64 family)